jgi:hypothetical protein
MNDDFEDVRKWIALKRYEQPPEGFVDDFLAEYQRRRDEVPVRSNPLRTFWEKLDGFFDSLSPPAWGLAGAAAMAVFAAVSWMSPQTQSDIQGGNNLNPVGMKQESFKAGPLLFTDEEETEDNKKKAAAESEKKAEPAPQR